MCYRSVHRLRGYNHQLGTEALHLDVEQTRAKRYEKGLTMDYFHSLKDIVANILMWPYLGGIIALGLYQSSFLPRICRKLIDISLCTSSHSRFACRIFRRFRLEAFVVGSAIRLYIRPKNAPRAK